MLPPFLGLAASGEDEEVRETENRTTNKGSKQKNHHVKEGKGGEQEENEEWIRRRSRNSIDESYRTRNCTQARTSSLGQKGN